MFLGRFPTTQTETRSAPFHIVWRVYPLPDLTQMSSILSGIAALERRNLVSLSVEFMDDIVGTPYALMELVVTERETGRVKHIALDLYDRADRIIPAALQFADIYFKRQFGPETHVAARGACAKVVPAGLPLGGYTSRALRHVCIAILASLRSPLARRTQGGLAALLRQSYFDARLWATLPRPDASTLKNTDVKARHIVFQPRLWETTPGSRDQFDVANEERIALVQALRRAFPEERTTIGLLRSGTAAEIAPDLRLPEHVRAGRYLQQLRASLVAVNCVGLSGSVGWKLAEYLGAGNAIVSQPIEKQFLSPLVEGVHYLAYRSPEECVEQCRRLMADTTLSKRMSEVNRQYFLDWVSPPAHVMHLLKRAFA